MGKFLALLLLVSQVARSQSILISFEGNSICKNKTEQLAFSITGNFNPGNYFSVQLSDSSGSFMQPSELTRFTNAAAQNVSFKLNDTTYLGTKYRLRVVSSNPVVTSNNNGTNLSVIDSCQIILPPRIILQNLSSNLICTPASISINWKVTNSVFSSSDSLSIQLSDSSGSFTNPYFLDAVFANDTTTNILIPKNITEGSKYRLRLILIQNISALNYFPNKVKKSDYTIDIDSSKISNSTSAFSIRVNPQPNIEISPSNACLGDSVMITVNDLEMDSTTFHWSGLGIGTNDTLKLNKARIQDAGIYTVEASNNGCSVTTSKELILSNCKPDWSWALTDTFWTDTFKYPSTITDTEIDQDNNLFVAGFFSTQSNLGNTYIHAIEGNAAYCDSSAKTTGFLAKINSDGQLLWYRKWNASTENSDYKYCDLSIDNGQVFIISEFNAYNSCSSTPRNQASLIISDEEDLALGSLIGFCRYAIPNTIPTKYNYRYKGRFAWAAKFDLSGNLDALSNLTELKSCSSSPTNFDSLPTYGLGNQGYYSIKARNNKLWLLYTWNQGLPNIIKFTNGSQYTNEAAGIVIAELNKSNLSILNFEKISVSSTNGALGLSNFEIDHQNNIIISGSSATTGIGSAQQILFGNTSLNFTKADYFAAKYNTVSKTWVWAKKSVLDQINDYLSLAPQITIDSLNNIYLGLNYKPISGGSFAGINFPDHSYDYDSSRAAALLKIAPNGVGQWVKQNNHQLREGRNNITIDKQENIYLASFLQNTSTAKEYLIGNHRLQQKELSTIKNKSGNLFIAVYKPSGKLVGTVSNIKIYNSIGINGFVVDSNQSVIISGQNFGKVSFGQLRVKTNYSSLADSLGDRQRAYISKISNPQSITTDSVSKHACVGESTEIRFNTFGKFPLNTQFKVQLIGVQGTNKGKVIEIAEGMNSPVSFLTTDALAENSYLVRIVTKDNKYVSTYRIDDTLVINSLPKPVILSNQLGFRVEQKICSTSLPTFRIQGWGGPQGILKYNENTIYVGSNIDYQPAPSQSGTYTISWVENGCTGVSQNLELNIYNPLTAVLSGNQTVSVAGNPAYLSLTVSGGKDYTVDIEGLQPFTSSKPTQLIPVYPTQNTSYKINSITNACGNATISGLANIIYCLNSIVLKNQIDNIDSGTVIKETSKSSGEIIADNQISDKAKVTYRSGKSIILNPGFYAADSVTFKAEIGGCHASPASPEQEFKLGYQKLFIHNGNVDQTIVEMTEFANKGAKLFEMTLRLEQVFKSLSQFNETNPTILNQYWALFDRVIAHANNIYDHIVFRIAVDYDDSRYYFQERDESRPNSQPYSNFQNALFDLFGGEIIQDQFGNPARVGYGSGHGSFASISAKEKMKGFVQKVIDRYAPILGQKLYWVSVVTSAQFETGNNYENAWNGYNFMSPKPCEYDYTPANINQFRTWLTTERYQGLAGFNAAYGTNYNNISQIQPPKVNVSILDNMTHDRLAEMYNTLLFEDWYKFNYKQMKSFLLDCKNIIKSSNQNIKFCFEAGSNTDHLSAARKTFNIPDINSYAEVLKTAFHTSTFAGAKVWDADLVRSNFTGEIQSEINEADVVNIGGFTNPSVVKQKMLEYSKMAYLNRAKSLIFVADKSSPYYNNSLDALGEFKSWVENHTEQLTEGQTMYVNLSDLIRNFSRAVAPFNAISPSLPANGYQNRPKIIIIPDN